MLTVKEYLNRREKVDFFITLTALLFIILAIGVVVLGALQKLFFPGLCLYIVGLLAAGFLVAISLLVYAGKYRPPISCELICYEFNSSRVGKEDSRVLILVGENEKILDNTQDISPMGHANYIDSYKRTPDTFTLKPDISKEVQVGGECVEVDLECELEADSDSDHKQYFDSLEFDYLWEFERKLKEEARKRLNEVLKKPLSEIPIKTIGASNSFLKKFGKKLLSSPINHDPFGGKTKVEGIPYCLTEVTLD